MANIIDLSNVKIQNKQDVQDFVKDAQIVKDLVEVTEDLAITTLEDLEEYAKGTVVRLPDFADGQKLVVRMRRPSMVQLAKSGKIPNTLFEAAQNLFDGQQLEDGEEVAQPQFDMNDAEAVQSMYDLVDVIVEASLVQPTYKQIKDLGITLTDEQLMAIFEYSQAGVNALKSFR